MTRRFTIRGGLLVLLAVVPSSVVAQQDGLDSVEALSADGRTEEARGALQAWWDGQRTQSSRRDRQRGLWLRAVLTVDPEMATLDYQRLVVGYPGGPYSDEALTRLAMIAGSNSDLLAAAGYYRTLLQDYPRSPERERARQWLDDHGPQIEVLEAEAEAAVQAEESDTPQVDVQEEAALEAEDTLVETEGGTPQEGSGSDRVTVAGPTEDPVVTGGAVVPVGNHAVQLGAFSTEERAERLARRLTTAGYTTRVVRVQGSDLVRVRVGRFESRGAAAEVMSEIQQLGYEAAVVADAAAEEPMR